MSTRKGLDFSNMKRIWLEPFTIAVFLLLMVVMLLLFRLNLGDPKCISDAVFSADEEDPAFVQTETIDLNSASVYELQMLPGVGAVIAERIIDHRENVGPFHAPEDLMQVSGIGEDTFSRLKDFVTVR